jgi:hypothetical protein
MTVQAATIFYVDLHSAAWVPKKLRSCDRDPQPELSVSWSKMGCGSLLAFPNRSCASGSTRSDLQPSTRSLAE